MSDADADADAIFTIEEREKLRAEILERDTLNAALTRKIEILEATLKATSANSITADNAANPEAALDEIDSFIRTVNSAPSGDTSYSNDDKTMLVTKKRLRKDEVGMSLEVRLDRGGGRSNESNSNSKLIFRSSPRSLPRSETEANTLPWLR